MNDTKKLLDLFPLNSVVFPHQKLSLRIFEPRYLKLIGTCQREARPFGVCLIREGKDVGAPAIPFKIGTSVVIKEYADVSDNLFYIVVQGERRFRIEHVIQEQPHIMAEIEWLDDDVPDFPGDYSILRNIITDVVKDKYKIPEDNNELFGLLGELIAGFPGEKQKILELPDGKVVPALTRLLESI
ncbi:MAG: LON peptidase substrate-binding domain-containing protein [Candidatus Brocadiales bacterium]|nr:LON peptidase substrate-binding domain-containing protein [Candidatus Brocadiales bacterium]